MQNCPNPHEECEQKVEDVCSGLLETLKDHAAASATLGCETAGSGVGEGSRELGSERNLLIARTPPIAACKNGDNDMFKVD